MALYGSFSKNTTLFKQKWIEKRIYGPFLREMLEKVNKIKTWDWLIQSDLKVETGIVVCCARTSEQIQVCIKSFVTCYLLTYFDCNVFTPCLYFDRFRIADDICGQGVEIKVSFLSIQLLPSLCCLVAM